MAMMPPAQPRGMPGMNTGHGGTGLDTNAGAGLSNLESIIAATVRAVTGQLSGIDGSADGSMLRRNGNLPALPGIDMTGTGSGAYGINRWHGADGVGGAWGGEAARHAGTTGMPSADAVRSGLLFSDNDPHTLYVGNVSADLTC